MDEHTAAEAAFAAADEAQATAGRACKVALQAFAQVRKFTRPRGEFVPWRICAPPPSEFTAGQACQGALQALALRREP
eukprot:1176635-Prorocentrum_minimum.AAC.5